MEYLMHDLMKGLKFLAALTLFVFVSCSDDSSEAAADITIDTSNYYTFSCQGQPRDLGEMTVVRTEHGFRVARRIGGPGPDWQFTFDDEGRFGDMSSRSRQLDG